MAGYIGTKAVALSTTTGNILGDMTVGGTTDVGTLEFNSLSGTGSVTITDILDEDNLASNSATKLATQQSIKAYVDAQVDTTDTLAEILAIGNRTSGAGKIEFRDAAIFINSSADGQLDLVADTEIQIAATTVDLNGNLDVSGTLGVTGVLTATSLDISGDIDVDGTTNLDAVDIDGAVQLDSTLTVGVNDTGYDVKFFGATSGRYMEWDASEDRLFLRDNTKLALGNGSDLEIYHDGTHSYVQESGSGDLLIYGNNLRLGNADGSELYILGNNNAEVQLRYNNATKLATSNIGISVTGRTTMDAGGSVFFGERGNLTHDASSYNMTFNANGLSAALVVEGTGNVTIGNQLTLSDGNLIVAAGHGIDFSAQTQSSASTNSEILNHYEQGSFTVTLKSPSGTEINAYASQTGFYVRVGARVHCHGYVVANGLGSVNGADAIKLGGFPFASVNVTNGHASIGVGYAENMNITAGENLGGFLGPAATSAQMTLFDGTAGTTSLLFSELSADGGFMYSISYNAV